MIDDILQYRTGIAHTAGNLLISEPTLADPNFQRAVIYLCHHDARESVGYVLNQQCPQDLSVFIDALNGQFFPLYRGGPVGSDTLHFIHSIPDLLGGEEVKGGVFWGGDLEQAVEGIRIGKVTPANCRFFLGYSGWGEGQLDAEMDMCSWLVGEASAELLFATHDDALWKKAVMSLGPNFKALLNIPSDPQLN
jgi:putative transcriptional regulator